jgi:hypothetical protein
MRKSVDKLITFEQILFFCKNVDANSQFFTPARRKGTVVLSFTLVRPSFRNIHILFDNFVKIKNFQEKVCAA